MRTKLDAFVCTTVCTGISHTCCAAAAVFVVDVVVVAVAVDAVLLHCHAGLSSAPSPPSNTLVQAQVVGGQRRW